jgi:hypothetical protein
MARIDIDIEDYLDEVDTSSLIDELKRRKDEVTEKDWREMEVPVFKDGEAVLKYFKKRLGLREWHDKKRLIREIEEL